MSVVPTSESTPAPVGARPLGVRVKPILRLGMGRKVTRERNGKQVTFPEKTDYFTVRGDERAVAKFLNEMGDKPKAIRMMLPAALDSALSIQYRAFKGGQDEGGGALVAVGHTNYALRDWCGGPDLLTVFDQDGTVRQVETLGLDAVTRQPLDDVAKDLGLELYTTLRAGMPDVLGFGSFFELTTKGKESTDNLWAKLREIYALFGSRTPIAVEPTLVIRSSTARPVVQKKGEAPKRIKTQIFVADVVVTEPVQAMLDRLEERQAILAPNGAAAAIYGAPIAVAEIGPGDVEPEPDYETVSDDEVEIVDEDSAGKVEGQQADGSASPAEPSVPDPEPVVDEEPEQAAFPVPTEALAAAADEALELVIPATALKGKTLAYLIDEGDQHHQEKLDEWCGWALRQPPIYWAAEGDEDGVLFARGLQAVVSTRRPDVWDAHVQAAAA